MKRQIAIIFSLVWLNAIPACIAQTVEAPYEVGTWKGFTKAAITYTFDDATSNQDALAIPMLNEFGFHATFFPVINWSPNWVNFQHAVDAGHEVGSHTMSHPHLPQLSAEDQEAELKNSQDAINANLTGQQCLTIAYSYCEPSIDTITRKYYIAARHCQGYTELSTPNNFLSISSIICGTQGSLQTTQQFNSKANAAAATSGWNVYLIHGVDNDGGYSPLASAVLRESLEYLHNNNDRFWVETFGNVARYIRERNAVSVDEISFAEDTIIVWVTDTLDDAIYNQPITVRRPLPEGWTYAQACQAGDSVRTAVKEIESVKYVEFDAVPDGGEVIITAAAEPPYRTHVDVPYEPAIWKGFAEAAITYTFDDNTSGQFSAAVPYLNEFGFQGTFFPVINWGPSWSNYQNAVNAGHEVGSHTMSHPHLADLSDSLQNVELQNAQDAINSHITGQQCLVIAYPFCEPSADSITRKYYIAARHCQGNIEKTTPDDFLNISSIPCGDQGSVNSTEAFNEIADSTAGLKGWSVYLIHGIDSDGGYSPVSSTVLHESLQYVADNPDKFWVSTFGNVARYIRERNSVSLEVIAMYPDSFQIMVTDTMANDPYDYPVTFRRYLPAAWDSAQVYQDGNPVETRLTGTGPNRKIEFNVVPDGGAVTIKKAVASQGPDQLETSKSEMKVSTMPNPFTDELIVRTDGLFRFSVFSADGRVMEIGHGYGSAVVGAGFRKGVYILMVHTGNGSYSTKIIKI